MFPALPRRTAAAFAAATLLPGLIVGFTATSAQAGIVGCDGRAATLSGTPGDDELTGTDGPDVIAGLGGFDRIYALGGDDIVCGGDGGDFLDGGAGDDRLFGSLGGDGLIGGEGNDFAKGGNANDYLAGDQGDDALRANGGRDTFENSVGADLMVGGPGRDFLNYRSSKQGVVIDLRRGAGAVSGNADDGPAGSRDELRRMEGVEGSFFDDTIYGNAKGNYIEGRAGEDTLLGRGGDDFLEADDAVADSVLCGVGLDSVLFDRGLDELDSCEVEAD